jgi:hypothetical protein
VDRNRAGGFASAALTIAPSDPYTRSFGDAGAAMR